MSDFVPSPPLTPPSHAGGSLSWEWARSGLSSQVEAALVANGRSCDPVTVAETSDLLVATVNQVRRLSRALGPSTTSALLSLVLKEDDTISLFPSRHQPQRVASSPWDTTSAAPTPGTSTTATTPSATITAAASPHLTGGENHSVADNLLPIGLLE